MPPSLFKIARIAAAHGLRGEVKLDCFLEDPSSLVRYDPLKTKAGKVFPVAITGQLKTQLIVKLAGIDDRNAAEALRGTELFADSALRPPPEEHSYYHDQLIGLPALLESGEKLGVVSAVHNYGAGDILELKPDAGESFYLSFTRETVLNIALDQGKITVRPPEEI